MEGRCGVIVHHITLYCCGLEHSLVRLVIRPSVLHILYSCNVLENPKIFESHVLDAANNDQVVLGWQEANKGE